MSDEIQYQPLQPRVAAPAADADLHHLHDVPVELAVEIGRTHMTIGETLNLGPGSIVSLNRLAGEPVDLLVNGKPIARGEVVVIDEEFGLRISDIVSPAGRLAEAEAAVQASFDADGASGAAAPAGGDPTGYLGGSGAAAEPGIAPSAVPPPAGEAGHIGFGPGAADELVDAGFGAQAAQDEPYLDGSTGEYGTSYVGGPAAADPSDEDIARFLDGSPPA